MLGTYYYVYCILVNNSSPLNVSSIQYVIFNTQCTYRMILMVTFGLFPRLFQALLMYMHALDMMDDDNNVVMESPREDFPSLNTIYSKSVLKSVCEC